MRQMAREKRDIKNIKNWSIHEVVHHGPASDLRLLLERGANPNERYPDGRTPLHMTAVLSEGDIEMAKILLEHGANPKLKDNKGQTPEDIRAGTKRTPELRRYLALLRRPVERHKNTQKRRK